MPANIVVVTVVIDSVPYVEAEPEMVTVMPRVNRMTLHVGYMQTADIPATVRKYLLGERERGATYYLSERRFVASDAGEVGETRERIFAFLHKNSQAPGANFNLPVDRVISIGTRIDL